MEFELVLLAERGEHAEVQDRAHLAREPRAVPDVVPAGGVQELGELAVEVVDVGLRLVDPGLAQDLGARLQSVLLAFLDRSRIHLVSFGKGATILSPMQKRLEGRVAIVTGGGHGIGKAYAHRLAEEGAKIVIAELDGP